MPPDGTHTTSWFTKVRGKFKVKYYQKLTDGTWGPQITPTSAILDSASTNGIKIFALADSYAEVPNVWYHTSEHAVAYSDFNYGIRIGLPAPVLNTRFSTKDVIDNALRAATPMGTSIAFDDCYDLSGAATANCYILEAPGFYKFKAVRGNDSENTVNLTGADISYIADNPNIIDGDCTIDGGYIKFKTKTADLEQGNVIITASNGGTTLWQWHLWVTNSANWHPAGEKTIHSSVGGVTTDYTFLPVSLGLCYTGAHETYKSYSMRVCIVGTDDDFNELEGRQKYSVVITITAFPYNIEEGYYYATYKWGDAVPSALKGYASKYYGSSTTPVFPVPAFSNSSPVQHTLATDTWNGSATTAGPYAATYGVTKTIYDPSPAGWHVPPPQATNNISTDGSTFGNVHGYSESTTGTSIVDLKVFNKHQDGSAISPGIAFWSKAGWYYWSSGTNQSGTISNAYGSYKTSASTWGPDAIGASTQGLVRPVKD